MKVVIDTSSLMALVRYYLPFDKNDSLKNFIENKVDNKEILILDKIQEESKRNAQGFIVKKIDFIVNKKNIISTNDILPTQGFLRDTENRLCYNAQRKKLNDIEFENRKKEFLESADAKLILYCLLTDKDMLNLDSVILVTEETRTDNDNKLFKKLPEICELLNIKHCNLPTLLNEHFKLKLSNFLK